MDNSMKKCVITAFDKRSDLRHIIERYGMPIRDYTVCGGKDYWVAIKNHEPVYQGTSYEDCVDWVFDRIDYGASP